MLPERGRSAVEHKCPPGNVSIRDNLVGQIVSPHPGQDFQNVARAEDAGGYAKDLLYLRMNVAPDMKGMSTFSNGDPHHYMDGNWK